MFLKRILPIGLIILTMIFGLWRYNSPPCVENPDYTLQNGWQGENPFEIKLERVPEVCLPFPSLGGANYIFSSRLSVSEKWREIFTSQSDDYLIDIPSDNVRVLNGKVAYAFILKKFAVTVDGGKSWTITELDKYLPNDYCCKQKLIQNVRLEDDGNGLMTLSFTTNGSNKVVELRTKDFGRTWEY